MKSRIALCLIGVSLAVGSGFGAAEANAAVTQENTAVAHWHEGWHCVRQPNGTYQAQHDPNDTLLSPHYCDKNGVLQIGNGPS